MSRLLLILLFSLAVLPARAEIECSTPMETWRPVADLVAKARSMGWTVQKVRADDGCYHLRATDKTGARVEAVFDPQTLELRGTSDGDHEDGDHEDGDHEDGGGTRDHDDGRGSQAPTESGGGSD